MMIELYQFPQMYSIPNPSPFCMKLESYLKAQGIEYNAHYTVDMRQSPTGKMPYIRHDNRYQSDSGLIIEWLESISEKPMQSTLDEADLGASMAIIRLCEESLYWTIVYQRWVDNNLANTWKNDLAENSNIPKLMFKIALKVMSKTVKKQLEAQGTGRMTAEQIYAKANQDLKALSDILGARAYFIADQPTLVDHVVYSFMTSIYATPWENALTTQAHHYPNLYAHTQRMLNQFFALDFNVSTSDA